MKSLRLYIVVLFQSLALVGYTGSLVNCDVATDNCANEHKHTDADDHSDSHNCECSGCVCHTPAIQSSFLPLPILTGSATAEFQPITTLLSAPTDPPLRPPHQA